jgi:ankyrin repeat protein
MLADDPSLAQARGAHNIPSLYFAAIGGSLEIAQALYEAGADINANPGKNTPLHGAAGFGRTEIVHWMLEQGADPAATDFNDLTPLEVAEKTGHQAAADAIRAKMAQYDAQLDAEDAAQ